MTPVFIAAADAIDRILADPAPRDVVTMDFLLRRMDDIEMDAVLAEPVLEADAVEAAVWRMME